MKTGTCRCGNRIFFANDQDLDKLGLGPLDLGFTSDAKQLVQAVLKVVVMVSEFYDDLGLPPRFWFIGGIRLRRIVI